MAQKLWGQERMDWSLETCLPALPSFRLTASYSDSWGHGKRVPGIHSLWLCLTMGFRNFKNWWVGGIRESLEMQVRDVLEDSSGAWWATQKTIILTELCRVARDRSDGEQQWSQHSPHWGKSTEGLKSAGPHRLERGWGGGETEQTVSKDSACEF